MRRAAISICFALLSQISALPPLDDETRAKIKDYLQTPLTRYGKRFETGHAEHARKLQGVDDEVQSALLTLGPKVELAVKDRLLRMAGRGDIFQELGTDPYNDLLKDVRLIRGFLGKELKTRRLDARPNVEPKPTPDASVYSSLPPPGAYNVSKLSDGRRVHRFSLSGPASKVHGSKGRRLFGNCKQNKIISTWSTVAGFTAPTMSALGDDLSSEKCGEAAVEGKLPGAATNEYKGTYCKISGSKYTTAKYGLLGYDCPAWPGFTDDSGCEVAQDDLPGSVKCKLELAVMESFSITMQVDLEFGYGGKGQEKDMIAELSVGVYTSQLPRPCLGAGDFICELLSAVAKGLNTLFDIGGSLGGKMMEGTVEMYPVRFGFPKGYEGVEGTGQKLFRIPIFNGADAAGAQTTNGVSLESGKMCLSDIGKNLVPSVGRIKMQLLAVGFLLSLSGSDVCIETPGVVKDAGSLKMGLQVKGWALDKSKVKVSGLWDLFPATFSPLVDGLSKAKGDFTDQQGLKEIFSEESCDSENPPNCGSLNADIETMIKTALPDQKVSIAIDIAEKAHAFAASSTSTEDDAWTTKEGDNYFFKINKVFATGRRLSSDRAPVEHDYVVLPIPTGPHPGLQARRLQTAYKIPPFVPEIQDGSKCIITITGMPKTLQCDLILELAPDINLYLRGQVKLMYDMKGTGMIMSSGFGFKIAFTAGTPDQATKDAIAAFENVFDIGAMIDPMLEGGVKLMPATVKLPPTYDDGTSVLEVAQLAVPQLKDKGLCIRTMKDLEGVPAMLSDLVESILTFAGVVGGDACVESPNLDVAAGFKMDMHAKGTVFDKTQVDLWPIIKTLSTLNPTLAIIVTVVEIVLPDDVKKALNDLVADLMPDKIEMTYNIGKAIGNATSRRLTSARGRRLSSSSLIDENGIFDLGGYPASDAPGSKAVGTEKTATDLPAGTATLPAPAPAASGGPAADGGGGSGGGTAAGSTADAVRSAKNAIPLLIVSVAAFTLE
jgi:hypothetical protein